MEEPVLTKEDRYKPNALLFALVGAMFLFYGFKAWGYEWSYIFFSIGAASLAQGILPVLNVNGKVTAVVKICFGILILIVSYFCGTGYGQTLVAPAAGAFFLVSGIFDFFSVPDMIAAIVEIFFGTVSLVLAVVYWEVVWRDMAFLLCVPVLMTASFRIREKVYAMAEASNDKDARKKAGNLANHMMFIIGAMVIIALVAGWWLHPEE